MTIDIIGAGIGGLTTAIALRQKGLDVRIWEQATALQPVGAGIVLAANAMQVYQGLGLLPTLLERGVSLKHAIISNADLSPLSTTDWSSLEAQHHVPTLAIHRGALQQTLLEQLPSDVLHLGHKLDHLSLHEQGATVLFEQGNSLESACVLAADGIHSKARALLFPKHEFRRSKQYCWRGVAPIALPEARRTVLHEAWGYGIRVGFVAIGPKQVYWFAVEPMHNHEAPTATADLATRFSKFSPLVVELIRSTSPKHIHGAELADLKPLEQWHKGVVGLLGDAAHAPTPNLGQGAGQAIEDARILAACLAQSNRPEAAFQQFETLRRPKVEKIRRVSWSIGQVAHWKNPIARQLRNWLLKATPKRVQQQQLNELATLEDLPQGNI